MISVEMLERIAREANESTLFDELQNLISGGWYVEFGKSYDGDDRPTNQCTLTIDAWSFDRQQRQFLASPYVVIGYGDTLDQAFFSTCSKIAKTTRDRMARAAEDAAAAEGGPA